MIWISATANLDGMHPAFFKSPVDVFEETLVVVADVLGLERPGRKQETILWSLPRNWCFKFVDDVISKSGLIKLSSKKNG